MISYRESTLVLQQRRKTLHSGKTLISSELNQQLSEFLEALGRRLEGRPVTNGSLKAKSTQISSGLLLSGFKASLMAIAVKEVIQGGINCDVV